MLQQLQRAAFHLRPITRQRQMKTGIILINDSDQISDFNLGVQLFFNFPNKGLFLSFARLHFAPWKFPAVFKFAVPALRGEDFTVFLNHSCDDFYVFICVWCHLKNPRQTH
jgi:hypothetical protein